MALAGTHRVATRRPAQQTLTITSTMSVALDSIWDEPITKSPSPPTRSRDEDDDDDEIFRPAKRPRSTLFLEDPDEEDNDDVAPPPARDAPPPGTNASARPDIDALFEDLDDDAPYGNADGADSRPFDLEAYRREALKRAEREAPSSSFTKYAVQSSSPPPEGAGDKAEGTAGKKGKNGEKEKMPRAKLDETRLLGKDGLPALVQLAKDFKPKGKGHEVRSDFLRPTSYGQC